MWADLMTSRKFIISALGIFCVIALAVLGKVTGNEALEFSKWVLGFWVLAQAATDSVDRLNP